MRHSLRSFHKFRKSILILILGYAFLYIPLFTIVAYSFNASRVLSVWQGFSWVWYQKVFENDAMWSAVFSSFKIACLSATLAVFLGTLAAVVTVRLRRIRFRRTLESLISAPLVMPDVMTGLALLLVCVSIQQTFGWPLERGVWSVTIAHVTLGMAYAYLVIQARLQDFDLSVEEAALDLGARPLTVFFTITIPMIAPALLSAWILAFALSLDDVVLASFLSGPGATTLPMLIFSSIRLGISPEMNALAAIIIAVVISLMIIVALVSLKERKE